MSRMLNVGFLSTRLSGTDGVSLEAAKWADLISRMGHSIAYCAGELDANGPEGMIVEQMHFRHPEVRAIHDMAFRGAGSHELRTRIDRVASVLQGAIRQFVRRFSIDLLVAENVLAIPMNIPLGVALRDEIGRSGCPTIAHHHDFAWERERFATCVIPDILDACFPPCAAPIKHVTISTLARQGLLARCGVDSVIVPNVLDFAQEPPNRRSRSNDLRSELGVDQSDIVLLQPTRVVPRKGIELAIELAGRLESLVRPRPVHLLISHAAGDEGMEYSTILRDMADVASVQLTMADDLVGPSGEPSGRRPPLFDLQDAYACADLVTYPSLIEGFGNAFLEAIYYRRPILVNRYPVYISDIEPCGFDVIAIDESIDDRTVEAVAKLLDSPNHVSQMTDHNYSVASKCFSYEVASARLQGLLEGFL